MIINIKGKEYDVDFHYSRAIFGQRDSFGAPETPDEPEEIEVLSVMRNGMDAMDFLGYDDYRELRKQISKAVKRGDSYDL